MKTPAIIVTSVISLAVIGIALYFLYIHPKMQGNDSTVPPVIVVPSVTPVVVPVVMNTTGGIRPLPTNAGGIPAFQPIPMATGKKNGYTLAS